MAYGIIRVKKIKSSAVGAMQYHNDRLPGEHSNEDIDPTRTPENHEFVSHGSYREEVADRIERYRQAKGKVRKDAVLLCEGIATASPEFFKGKTSDETLAYFEDVFAFVKKEAGEENLIHFTVHLDETTPHAHFGFTPIKDGSLSWKKFFDGKYALRAFQDRYWEQVGKLWGLERGEKSEISGRTHKETAQMKREADRELHRVRQQTEQEVQRLESVRQAVKEMEPAAQTISESARTLIASRGDGERERELARENSELRERASDLEQQIATVRARVEDFDRGLPELRGRYRELEGRYREYGERFETLKEQLTAVIQRLREIPETLSAWTLDIARQLGKHIYNSNSLEYMTHALRDSARAQNANRGYVQEVYRHTR